MRKIASLYFDEIFEKNKNDLKSFFFENKILHIKSSRPLMIVDIKGICQIFGGLYKNNSDSKFNIEGETAVQRVSNSHNNIVGLFENYELNWHNDFAHSPGEYHGTALYNQANGEAVETLFCDIQKGFELLSENLIQKYSNTELSHAPRETAFLGLALSHAERRLLRQKKCKIDGPFSHDCFHDKITHRKLFQTHPITKKKSIYLSPATIDQTPIKEDFSKLLEACTQATFSHQWQPHDLLLFDNLSLMHSRKSFSGDRILYRLQFNYDRC